MVETRQVSTLLKIGSYAISKNSVRPFPLQLKFGLAISNSATEDYQLA